MAVNINSLIAVAVNRAILAAQGQSQTSALVLGSSDIIDVTARKRPYNTLAAVAADFGTSAPEYQAAQNWFTPSGAGTLYIGQWCKTAVAGRLIGAVLPTASQLMSVWNTFTAGQFKIQVNGGTLTNITCGTFASATNLNGIATIINTALAAATIPAVVAWNSTYQQFTIRSTTTGTTSTVAFLQAGTANDIASLMGMLSTSSGAYSVGGLAAETAVNAVALFDANWGNLWYSLVVAGAVDADHQAIAAYIEPISGALHAYGVTTSNAACLVSGDTSNIGYLLNAAGYSRTAVAYSSTNSFEILNAFSLLQMVDYTGNNTVKNAMWKQLPGTVPENIAASQYSALDAFKINYYTQVSTTPPVSIFMRGLMCSGNWMDDIFGTDALTIALQIAQFNVLYTNPTKIPQTNKGMDMFVTAMNAVCEQFVKNGFLAAGTWTLTGFGALNNGDFLPRGYYIYAPDIATQSVADRGARKTVLFQIAAKLAGAVDTVSTIITINQ